MIGRRCRVWSASAALLVAAAASGCGIGHGSGKVSGSLHVDMCKWKDDKLVDFDPQPDYRWDATFIVGEPIDSPDPAFYPNTLLIRVQHSSKRLELADVLAFYLIDLYEVGRCLRGRTDPATGQPDWNQAVCDRTGPEPRVLIGTEAEVIRSYLLLNETCTGAMLPNQLTVPINAQALGLCDLATCPTVTLCPGRGSWITFSRLGSLSNDLSAPLDRNFKVNFDEQIVASDFHVELCDARTVVTTRLTDVLMMPVPTPLILGSLSGMFEFDLERGQAGQAFP